MVGDDEGKQGAQNGQKELQLVCSGVFDEVRGNASDPRV
jgi:hypothetical protein